MNRLFLLSIIVLINSKCFSQEKKSEDGLGISFAANYTFSGIGVIADVEWQNRHHIFYTGPKFQLSRSYLPMKGSFGWNIGYRHEYNKSPEKITSFFFNADYQIGISKPLSRGKKTNKMNYVHEAFIGYGVQFKLCSHLYLANVLGIGGHFESYYNTDLYKRRTYVGYNNMFKIFLNYKF